MVDDYSSLADCTSADTARPRTSTSALAAATNCYAHATAIPRHWKCSNSGLTCIDALYNQHVDVSNSPGRDAILTAAAQVIRRYGVRGTTISRIVAQSGMSAGAIYHHFPNKQAVVLAVADQTLEFPLTALTNYRDTPSSPQEVLGFALYALKADRTLSDLLVQLGTGAAIEEPVGHELRARFTHLQDELRITLRAWAEQNHKAPDELQSYTQVIHGVVLGFAIQRNLVDSFDEDGYIAQGLDLLAIDTED